MDKGISKDKILQTLQAHERQLKDYGVMEIGLFGSYVRGAKQLQIVISIYWWISKRKKRRSVISCH
ncbi:MAG: hypothetical protein JWR18_1831 [Segetibacter sp.]|nr:hypothetical protein [Segetibacter sp.]